VAKDTSCVWAEIVEKMSALGRLEELMAEPPIKDWRTGRDGGPRKIVREELVK
jgi:hypothetical protein